MSLNASSCSAFQDLQQAHGTKCTNYNGNLVIFRFRDVDSKLCISEVWWIDVGFAHDLRKLGRARHTQTSSVGTQARMEHVFYDTEDEETFGMEVDWQDNDGVFEEGWETEDDYEVELPPPPLEIEDLDPPSDNEDASDDDVTGAVIDF